VSNISWVAQRAEDVDAESSFELVTIGNAFDRLWRQVVADRATTWLAPGGHIALLWCNSPWVGGAPWQEVLDKAIHEWMEASATKDRVPIWRDAIEQQPHSVVLKRAGFSFLCNFEFSIPHHWTTDAVIGNVYSTSFLSKQALGVQAEAFEVDLRQRLLDCEPSGSFEETISFSYDLARLLS
jgi:hypothetical protein